MPKESAVEIMVFKPHECGLVLMSSPPSIDTLDDLPITSKTAYIRNGDSLFYIDKSLKMCIKLEIGQEKLNEFDTKLQPTKHYKTLSSEELDRITLITGHNPKGVHENLWIKQRVKQYVSIGVYLDGSDLKYYFFENRDKTPKIYTSLVELKRELPSGLENIFENTPKLFIMGHGHGGIYGLANHDNPSEIIHNEDFDEILSDFEKALPESHGEISVTLEACNTDNRAQRAEGEEKTFLERVSETHRHMTFCGTGPWDPENVETGYRASGGFPILNAPITSMGGGIWKHGNSVIFYYDNFQYQVVVRKSLFASTETAKQLKINTIEYAREILKKSSLDDAKKEELITKICASRDILKIEDLKKIRDFPPEEFENQKITELMVEEQQILKKEKDNYIMRVQAILARAKSGENFTDRDLLIVALGLKDLSVFNGHEDLRNEILANKALLQLVLVSCGKVLIAGPNNDSIIDLLLKNGIDINSVDEKGMTALHYAVQNFYNYRKEPVSPAFNLINKLLDCGANLEAEDKEGRTPLTLATEHGRKGTVIAGENLQELLEQRLERAVPVNSQKCSALHEWRSFNAASKSVEHGHDDPRLQHEDDKRFGLVL